MTLNDVIDEIESAIGMLEGEGAPTRGLHQAIEFLEQYRWVFDEEVK